MKREIRRSKDIDDKIIVKLLDLVDETPNAPTDEELFVILNKAYELGAGKRGDAK